MGAPIVHFKYFESPERFGHFLEKETTCDLCGKHTRCFDGSVFIGENDIEAVCLECLEKGRLKELDIVTCQGDTNELRNQLQVLHPHATAGEISNMVKERTAE